MWHMQNAKPVQTHLSLQCENWMLSTLSFEGKTEGKSQNSIFFCSPFKTLLFCIIKKVSLLKEKTNLF